MTTKDCPYCNQQVEFDDDHRIAEHPVLGAGSQGPFCGLSEKIVNASALSAAPKSDEE